MKVLGKLARGSLWVAAPPLGIWSSVHHGIKEHEKRQAKLFGEELRREPTPVDLELARLKKELGK